MFIIIIIDINNTTIKIQIFDVVTNLHGNDIVYIIIVRQLNAIFGVCDVGPSSSSSYVLIALLDVFNYFLYSVHYVLVIYFQCVNSLVVNKGMRLFTNVVLYNKNLIMLWI